MLDNIKSIATAMWVRLVIATTGSYNSTTFPIGSFTNIRANGYTLDDITLVTPYGAGGLPPPNSIGLLTPVEDSNKSYVNLGFGQTIPSCAYTPSSGDSWYNSQNYVIFWQETGVQACRINDSTYIATVPNGEYVGQLILNRITEIENMISQINNNYTSLISQFNSHTHGGVSTGGSNTGNPTGSLTQTSLPVPATLGNDTTAINDQYYLINNNGRLP